MNNKDHNHLAYGMILREFKNKNPEIEIVDYRPCCELFEKILNEICDKYCKYPNIYDPEEHDGVELCDSDICENCPLEKIY